MDVFVLLDLLDLLLIFGMNQSLRIAVILKNKNLQKFIPTLK